MMHQRTWLGLLVVLALLNVGAVQVTDAADIIDVNVGDINVDLEVQEGSGNGEMDKPNVCKNDPNITCFNGGTCTIESKYGLPYECICLFGFGGVHCEIDEFEYLHTTPNVTADTAEKKDNPSGVRNHYRFVIIAVCSILIVLAVIGAGYFVQKYYGGRRCLNNLPFLKTDVQ